MGGSTDYPDWYKEHGGAVISSSINKYCYLMVRYLPPFFEHKYRVVWSQIELPNRVDDIVHPKVRESLKYLGMTQGIEVHHAGDLPARSGIGSSSAFTVGLLYALHALKGEEVSRYELALEAIHVEQDLVGEKVGCQDQIACACGSMNYIKFGNHRPIINPLNMDAARLKSLESCLMLVFAGFPHIAAEVASTYDFQKRQDELTKMGELTKETYNILMDGNLLDLGRLLNEAWEIKKALSDKVSTPYVDYLYSEAMKNGASGVKLLGAGGGGFMLLFCEPDKQAKLRNSKAFKGLLFVPFQFENSGVRLMPNGVG